MYKYIYIYADIFIHIKGKYICIHICAYVHQDKGTACPYCVNCMHMYLCIYIYIHTHAHICIYAPACLHMFNDIYTAHLCCACKCAAYICVQ